MKKEYAQYLIDKTKADYNAISEEFSRTRRTKNIVWGDLKAFLDYTRPGDKVLDVGCGNGRLYGALKEKNISYVGTDISEQLVKKAQEEFPEAKFQIADTLSLPFADSFFDKVYCIATLHHIPSKQLRRESLKEMRRVLKPDGLLILTVWNLWQRKTAWKLFIKATLLKLIGLSRLDFKDILFPWKDNSRQVLAQRYFHLFTKQELYFLAEDAGFKVKEIGLTQRPELKDTNIYIICQK